MESAYCKIPRFFILILHFKICIWMPRLDLHQDRRGQNPACCCYTTRHSNGTCGMQIAKFLKNERESQFRIESIGTWVKNGFHAEERW